MSRYEATFEIESKTDARAVRRAIELAYNTFREELKEPHQGDASPPETLQQLKAIREASRSQSPGTVTIIYESHDETFDD